MPETERTAKLGEFNAAHGKFSGYTLDAESTPDGIARLYAEKYLGSCMGHDAGHFNTPKHPCFVYGAGDLTCLVARDKHGDIVARCMAWIEREKISRIYGDVSAMQSLILREYNIETESDGCNYDSLEGARLLKIEHEYDDAYVVPYVDSVQYAYDDGEFLILNDDRGGINTHASHECSGWSREVDSGEACERCGDRVPDDETCGVVVERGYIETWCDCCASDNSFSCEDTGNRYADNEFTEIEVHTRYPWDNCDVVETWCQERARATFQCDHDGEYYDPRYHNSITVDGDETWHEKHIESGEIFYCHGEEIWLTYRFNHMVMGADGQTYSRDYARADADFDAQDWDDLPDHPNNPQASLFDDDNVENSEETEAA